MTPAADAVPAEFALTDQQLHYFNQFGFLVVPGLFADDIDRIDRGFEAVFADESNERMETYVDLHKNQKRVIIPQFIDRSPDLAWIRDDPRVTTIARQLIGDNFEYAESDGNTFDCESSWHPDVYGAPISQLHIKLSFYLEPLRRDSGAIRVIPGTSFHTSPYARFLRRDIEDSLTIAERFGVDDRDLPSWPIETDPGDLALWNYRTIHASFDGGMRRRLFSVSFREPTQAED